MSYKDMLAKLKEEKKEDIILIKNGVFYIAIGNDAVLLHKILGLKCTCFSKEICKVGIPIASIDKYTQRLKEKDYKYTIYELEENKINKDEIEIKLKQTNKDGLNKNNEIIKSLECSKCPSCKFSQDKYDRAFETYKNNKIKCS